METFTEALKLRALELGFVLSGVTAAAEPARYKQFLTWLDTGMHGQMHYLETRRAAYASPASILDGCTTLLMLAYPYRTQEPSTIEPGSGRVARYAWGEPDYHDQVFTQLKSLKHWIQEQHPTAQVRGVVDTAPLLEREFAEAAGLGWVGKNTLLLNRTWGSYFFLAALLTNLPLRLDEPYSKNYCGTCQACLKACPTDAFPQAYVLDARRCISYLTIEHREAIDPELASRMGDWMFGCDICQEVCPWNRRAATSPTALPHPFPSLSPASLVEILQLNDDQFKRLYRQTPLWRAKRRGIIRNACLVLGNQRYRAALSALETLLGDEEPLIRGAAVWAIDKINNSAT
ncbi:MAG: tRNA epoxyqueuosine(34) reductase QueG [Pirellulaceae bacterium]|nr:tRNA epoxyqueuosine(34) reductase QueG [Pirellulaceae bacterium]